MMTDWIDIGVVAVSGNMDINMDTTNTTKTNTKQKSILMLSKPKILLPKPLTLLPLLISYVECVI